MKREKRETRPRWMIAKTCVVTHAGVSLSSLSQPTTLAQWASGVALATNTNSLEAIRQPLFGHPSWGARNVTARLTSPHSRQFTRHHLTKPRSLVPCTAEECLLSRCTVLCYIFYYALIIQLNEGSFNDSGSDRVGHHFDSVTRFIRQD